MLYRQNQEEEPKSIMAVEDPETRPLSNWNIRYGGYYQFIGGCQKERSQRSDSKDHSGKKSPTNMQRETVHLNCPRKSKKLFKLHKTNCGGPTINCRCRHFH